jgi:hypothetical protein
LLGRFFLEVSGRIGSIEVFRSVRSRGGSADAQGDADAKSLEKGSWIAQNATQYNKGLHRPAAMELEKARNENPDRAVRLDAAACALAHCSASVPTTDKHYDELQALEAAGAGYTRELAELKRQVSSTMATWTVLTTSSPGMMRRQPGPALLSAPV